MGLTSRQHRTVSALEDFARRNQRLTSPPESVPKPQKPESASDHKTIRKDCN